MKLLSFGEIIWDIYSADNRTLGGAPLNFASYSAMLGSSTFLASAVGEDELGKEAIKQIKEFGVNTEYVLSIKDKITGQCQITLDKNAVPTYNIVSDVAYDYISLPDKLTTDFDVIAFGTLALREKYNKKTLQSILDNNEFSEIFTDLNIRAPFYSKISIDFCLSNATIVKISDEELPIITKEIFSKDFEIKDAVISLSNKYPQIRLIIITCGAKGAYCFDTKNEKTYFCPAQSVSVVSTVGAGDSFGATFLSTYYKTKDIQYSLELSAKVSAFVVSHSEAIPPLSKVFIKKII